MVIIKKVIDFMHNTLDEAEKYYDFYNYNNDDFPKITKVALNMAKYHLDLYMQWHNEVIGLINDYKAKNGDVPEQMKKIWNDKHKELTDEYDYLYFRVKNALANM